MTSVTRSIDDPECNFGACVCSRMLDGTQAESLTTDLGDYADPHSCPNCSLPVGVLPYRLNTSSGKLELLLMQQYSEHKRKQWTMLGEWVG